MLKKLTNLHYIFKLLDIYEELEAVAIIRGSGIGVGVGVGSCCQWTIGFS